MTDKENTEATEKPIESGKTGLLDDLKPSNLDLGWLVNSALVTIVAGFLRFYWLELKPLHHDEGVNGHFLTKLFREGVYQYDPSNYHGPDLYYFSLAFAKLFGLNTLSVRWSVAIFGLLTVVLVLFLRRWLGKIGSLSAALLVALSPAMVYISRYFIHEIIFVFFSLSFVLAILYFIEKKRLGLFGAAWMFLLLMVCFLPTAMRIPAYLAGSNNVLFWSLAIGIFLIETVLVVFVMRMLLAWDDGRPAYLLLAATSLVFLFATKETAFITIGTMIIAAFCVGIWRKITGSGTSSRLRKVIAVGTAALLWIVSGILVAVYFEPFKLFYLSLDDFFASPEGPDQVWLLNLLIGLVAAAYLCVTVESVRLFLRSAEETDVAKPALRDFAGAIKDRLDLILITVGCLFIFTYVGVLFFSSFFTYPAGIAGAFQAYAIWSETGSQDHTKGAAEYLRWLLQTDSPALILSAAGAVIALARAKNPFAMFAGLWAMGLLAAYSIIPYKTPWLSLSFVLPMCIVGGYAIGELAKSEWVVSKALAAILAVLSFGIMAFQTYDTNFVRYDDERMPYVYAHTKRGFHDLIADIERTAEMSDAKMNAKIDIVSPDYWPMPWYLNDYPNATFWGKTTDRSDAEMIVASENQLEEVKSRYGGTHTVAGTYPLRPGVELVLMIRNDLK